jgi:hypothetical protein
MTSLVSATAQLSVEVILDQEQFLLGEAVPAKVRVTNRSGQELQLGKDATWLTFSVEGGEGSVIRRNGNVPVIEPFTLPSSKMATSKVELTPYFELSRAGRYRVIATVHIKGWDKDFLSPAKSFDVISGAKLWSQEIGVPGRTNQAPEVRKYVLQQANYLNTPRLYIKLCDRTEQKITKVYSLGNLVSFTSPDPQVDRYSNLHLLFQNGARTFSYNLVTPDGELKLRQTYESTGVSPRLRMSEDGKFEVTGGMRRISQSDVPAPKTTEADAASR